MKRNITLMIFCSLLLFCSSVFASDDGYINQDCNLYVTPSSDAKVISFLKQGTTVEEIGQLSQDGKYVWIEIDQKGPDLEGWVLVSCVNRLNKHHNGHNNHHDGYINYYI